MLNPNDFNAELHQRVVETVLKIKLAGILDDDEMHALCWAAGVQVPTQPKESRLQRLQRMAREAEEWRKQQDIQQVELRG